MFLIFWDIHQIPISVVHLQVPCQDVSRYHQIFVKPTAWAKDYNKPIVGSEGAENLKK